MSENSEDKVIELLLEQYKLYVEMMDRTSARRIDATKLYISLLTALLAVLPIVLNQSIPLSTQPFACLMTAVMGIALCVIWAINITSYRQLNSLKFRVIHEMEQNLPFPCYDREWKILEEEPKRQKYRRLWKVERYIPLLLIAPYLILLIYALTVMFY